MKSIVALLAITSMAAAHFNFHHDSSANSGSNSFSNSNEHHLALRGSHSSSCEARYHPNGACGCQKSASSSCSNERVIRHKPKVFVKHHRVVVNHPQKVTKITRKETHHKHVIHRMPKVYNKVVVKHNVRKSCRKLPLHTKTCQHSSSSSNECGCHKKFGRGSYSSSNSHENFGHGGHGW